MKTISAALLSLLVLLSFLPAQSKAEDKRPSVEYGKKLFSDPYLGTNGKSCASCHSEADLKKFAAKDSWFGGQVKTLEEAVNVCVKGMLEGKPLPKDSAEMQSLVAYIKSFKAK